MALDTTREDLTVGVIGAGAMGRGIAQVSAQGGMQVLMFDAAEGTAAKGRDYIYSMLDRSAQRGRMSSEDAAKAKARIRVVEQIADLAPAALVVEAVVENLAIKRKVFQAVEAVVPADTIIVSNTSSIRIASIAAVCTHKGRIAGMHFFNPVPLMPLVEVVRAPATAAETAASLSALGKRMGRVPVVVQDSPGFLVNLGGRSYTTEGLRIHAEGVASPAQIDAVLRDACGFRMGPFELMDLTGIDVNYPVSQIIFEGYYHDRRLATSPMHAAMMEAGRLGRKTRQGWFSYDDKGNKLPGSDDGVDAVSNAAPAARVVLAEADPRLARLFRDDGAEVAEADDGKSPLVAAPQGEDCTAVAARLGLAADRLVAVDLSGNIAKRLTVMTAPSTAHTCLDAVIARLQQSGAAVTAIKDSPGFIAQRMRGMIANLGCEMAQIGIASPADIDTAMKLGLNYPQGPLEMVELMGTRATYDIMTRLQEITGDDRYRPSLWLRRRALLDLPINTPD
jgi:3-hydroxybutyryl-CoA dehydrogenase